MLATLWTDLIIVPELERIHYGRHYVLVIIYVMVICCCLFQINLLGFSVKALLCGTEN